MDTSKFLEVADLMIASDQGVTLSKRQTEELCASIRQLTDDYDKLVVNLAATRTSPMPVQIGSGRFNPETVPGITFFDAVSNRKMRYIDPNASHWARGWIVVLNPSGQWMTLRQATPADIAALEAAKGHNAPFSIGGHTK